ncbi:MAG: metal-dependent transcriptional regulator [Dehalococcoidales bacterium]|nr:metal-dependent transcriptional regulator [Dehalococcoidales bacterium]
MSERTVEEYLESISVLEEIKGVPVRTSSLAQVLEVSPASVSEMLHRLSERGLVNYAPYEGVSLSRAGRLMVLKLTRRHRLWEVFFNKYLGVDWEDVYQEACNLEHATSELLTDKLAEFLGNPPVCPHGSPIPNKKLEQPRTSGIPLAELEVGQTAKIVCVVRENNSRLLRHLTGLQLVPGAMVKVMEKTPFDGTLTIEVNGSTRAIGREASSFVMAEPV